MWTVHLEAALEAIIERADAVNFWLPTPPLEEQRRIADSAAAAAGRLDTTVDAVHEQLVRQHRLEAFQVFWAQEVEAFCKFFYAPKEKQSVSDQAKMYRQLGPPVDRFKAKGEDEQQEYGANQAIVAGTLQIPAGLTRQHLLDYRAAALRAIQKAEGKAAGPGAEAVQRARIQLIDEILSSGRL